MKALHNLVFVLAAFLFLGCSNDAFEETILTQESFERTTEFEKKNSNMEFHIDIRGEFKLVRTYACNGLSQIEMQGEGEISLFGPISTRATLCTDFGKNQYSTGSFLYENGDVLFFETKEHGMDNVGEYNQIVLYGDKGKFKDFYGTAKVYLTQEYTGHNVGYFRETGSGIGQWLTSH